MNESTATSGGELARTLALLTDRPGGRALLLALARGDVEALGGWLDGTELPVDDRLYALAGAFSLDAADLLAARDRDRVAAFRFPDDAFGTWLRQRLDDTGERITPQLLEKVIDLPAGTVASWQDTLPTTAQRELLVELLGDADGLDRACEVARAERARGSVTVADTPFADEWDEPVDPARIAVGTDVIFAWRCTGCDGRWEASPRSRARDRLGCRRCAARPPRELRLIATHPHLAAQWDDAQLSAEDVTATSTHTVSWRCTNLHRFQAAVAARATDPACPRCTSLAYTHPPVAALWHRDNTLNPDEVDQHSDIWVLWQCPDHPGHAWPGPVQATADDPTCAHCTGRPIDVRPGTLAEVAPHLEPEWDDRRPFVLTDAASLERVRWRCTAGHRWSASPLARAWARAACPVCRHGWLPDDLREVIAALVEQLPQMTPAELFVLFIQSGVAADAASALAAAVSAGTVSTADLADFAGGRPSPLDPVLRDPDSRPPAEDDELPELADPGTTLALIDDQVAHVEDEEAVEFLVSSAVSKLWAAAWTEPDTARQAALDATGEYASRAAGRFLSQLHEAEQLPLPDDLHLTAADGSPLTPNLMQRLVAVQVRDRHRVGNWSGTGAGKTLSALLAARTVDARLTLVISPNAVIDGWRRTIEAVFPDADIATKTLTPHATLFDRPGAPRFLLVNFEHLQRDAAEDEIRQLTTQHRIDLVVIDEIHFAKQRDRWKSSLRARNLRLLLELAGGRNDQLRVLGMTATPVINNLREGRSLLELIAGTDLDRLEDSPTLVNAVALHQQLVTAGLRWMPAYDLNLVRSEPPTALDDATVRELAALPAGAGPLQIERLLLPAKLPALVAVATAGGRTLVYSHYVDGMLDPVEEALTTAGLRCGRFNGEDKSGLDAFRRRQIDVLLGSSAVATGVDGLQEVCSRLVVLSPPWTDAQFQQLKGRVFRQGQAAKDVELVVPVTYAHVDGQRWSWDEQRLARLTYKRSIADAAVDGILSGLRTITPEQASDYALAWLRALRDGPANVPAATVGLPVRQAASFGADDTFAARELRLLERGVKVDPDRLAEIGDDAERAFVSYLLTELEPHGRAGTVRHASETSDQLGYDVSWDAPERARHAAEVKAVLAGEPEPSIVLTRNEWEVACQFPDRWQLVLVDHDSAVLGALGSEDLGGLVAGAADGHAARWAALQVTVPIGRLGPVAGLG